MLSYEHKLKQREDKINDLERDAPYFRDKRFFDHDGYQKYLAFQLMYEYLKRVVVTSNNISTICIHSWTSKRLSNEKTTPPGTSNNNTQASSLEYDGREISLTFSGDLLKQSESLKSSLDVII